MFLPYSVQMLCAVTAKNLRSVNKYETRGRLKGNERASFEDTLSLDQRDEPRKAISFLFDQVDVGQAGQVRRNHHSSRTGSEIFKEYSRRPERRPPKNDSKKWEQGKRKEPSLDSSLRKIVTPLSILLEELENLKSRSSLPFFKEGEILLG